MTWPLPFELLEKHAWGRTVLAVVSFDFEGDGDRDLAVGLEAVVGRGESHEWIREWGAVEVLRNDGTGRFELAAREPTEQFAGALHARDLDLDGDEDLVVSGGGFPVRSEVKLRARSPSTVRGSSSCRSRGLLTSGGPAASPSISPLAHGTTVG